MYHWYDNGAPVAVTDSVAVWPLFTVLPCGCAVIVGLQTLTVTGELSAVQVPSLMRTQYCVVVDGVTVFCPSPDPEAIRRLFAPVPAYHS
jgi:hypothetical protein